MPSGILYDCDRHKVAFDPEVTQYVACAEAWLIIAVPVRIAVGPPGLADLQVHRDFVGVGSFAPQCRVPSVFLRSWRRCEYEAKAEVLGI